jgi:hypothetical protein
MPRKPIELPPEVAKAFVRDMRAFHARRALLRETRSLAAKSMPCVSYQGKSERPIKLHQVKQMFEEMRDDLA